MTVNKASLRAAGIGVLLALSLPGISMAQGGNNGVLSLQTTEGKVTICHNPPGNPGKYNVQTLDAEGVYNGHLKNHDGDIIPPFWYDGEEYSQNWDAEGEAIFNNGCKVPDPTSTPTEVPVETPTDVPVETPTDVPVETPTDVPVETPTDVPVETPTELPTETPTAVATETPTLVPTDEPTSTPTQVPLTPGVTTTPDPTKAPKTPVPTKAPQTPMPTKAPKTPAPTAPVSTLPNTGTGSGSETGMGLALAALAASALAGASVIVRRRR
ncbi:MAG: hypothetical protein WBA46_15020 [Thermomicrobiales bacterium]